MPKRPCAVILTPDESTILCADKFGDVYSLPLISVSHNKTYNDQDSVDQSSKEDSEPSQTPFVPAANSRTVHTLRNQKALQNQQKITHKEVNKKTLEFDYQLLLGHVSLLTDLVCVRLTNTITASSQPRTYILTSDRDEHIRVSRGIPQAHIIEGYCLGHTEFISKLCTPKWHQKLLVSGGGDDYLLAWDWLSGRVRQKVDLRGPMQEFRKTYRSYENSMISFPATKESCDFKGSGEDYETKIAVSGIWAMDGFDIQPKQLGGYIILACEG